MYIYIYIHNIYIYIYTYIYVYTHTHNHTFTHNVSLPRAVCVERDDSGGASCLTLLAYASIFGLRPVSLCSYILPLGVYPIIIDLVSERIAYAPIFCLRARS